MSHRILLTGSDPAIDIRQAQASVTEGLQVRWILPNGLSNYEVDFTLDPPVNGIITAVRVGSKAPGATVNYAQANQDITVTWPGTGTAVLSDPNNEISNFSDGAVITSGTVLSFLGGSLQDSVWSMDIDVSAISGQFVIDYDAAFTTLGLGNEGVAFIPIIGSDSDADGIVNDLDLDSDNDGISDLVESGASQLAIDADFNSDGTVTLAESQAIAGGSGDDTDNDGLMDVFAATTGTCLLYTSPSPRDKRQSRMPSSA